MKIRPLRPLLTALLVTACGRSVPGIRPAILPSPTSPIPAAGSTPLATFEPSTAPLAIVPLTGDEVARYGLVELEIQTTPAAANPFDPGELDLRVAFTASSGAVTEIGAVWYLGFDPTGHRTQGEPGWRARFTPTETGPWTVDDPAQVNYLYPALLDPESGSRNFETTGPTAYLYFTRNNFGHTSLDRDLMRVPVAFFPSPQAVELEDFAQ
jgi:hypothetical protein